MNQEETNKVMTRKFNTVGGWCGSFYGISALIGWCFMAGYWPLHKPTDSAEVINAFYQDNLLMLRLGLIVLMWAAPVILIFTAAVANHLQRIEGRSGPLTYCMIMGGFATAVLTFYPPLWWLTAAYRPDGRTIEMIQMLNDAGWLQFVGGVSLVVTMYIAVAIAAFIDKSAQPTFPRWVGYFSLWTLFMFVPGQLVFIFKTGPFAWNGLLAFWIPGSLFFAWFIIVGILVIKASGREKQA